MSFQKNHTAFAMLFGAECAVLLPGSCQREVPADVKITFGSVYTSVDLTTGEPGDPAEMSYVSTVDVIPAFSTGDDNPIEKEIN